MAGTWSSSIKYSFGNLTRFSGRDRPGHFWPYAGTIVGISVASWYLLGFLVMRSVLAPRSGAVQSAPRDLMLIMMLVMGAIVLANVFLLAAGAVRRLHDSGRGGWLVATPMLFFTLFLLGMVIARTTMVGVRPPALLMLLMFISNIAYMISMLVLTVFLAWTSDPNENRYGPQPDTIT